MSNTNRYLAFDIEIAKVTEDGKPLESQHPLGISCWALAGPEVDNERDSRFGYGHRQAEQIDGHASELDQIEAMLLVQRLQDRVDNGYTLVTHNGAAFDFMVLAEESGLWGDCRALAWHCIDICFLVHCLKGFPVGLDAVCRGMQVAGKKEGIDGNQAPYLWSQGEYRTVIDYVLQDAKATVDVARAIEEQKELRWIARSGKLNTLSLPNLLTVKEANRLPLPNTSWMADPWPRSKFIGWLSDTKGKDRA